MLGDEWDFVGDGKVAIGGLIPDFVHKTRREVLQVLGCYYHSCPIHFPNVRKERTTPVAFKEQVYQDSGYAPIFLWEHEIKRMRRLAFKAAGLKDPSVYAK